MGSFNPRSRTGSDLRRHRAALRVSVFQSTLPHGERHLAQFIFHRHQRGFNPRSRTGSDRVT